MIKLRCIKTLYKSTYKGNAFTRNKLYEIRSDKNHDFIHILDNQGRFFGFEKPQLRFTKQYYKQAGMYRIQDYFSPNPANKRFVIIEKINEPFNFKEKDYENK